MINHLILTKAALAPSPQPLRTLPSLAPSPQPLHQHLAQACATHNHVLNALDAAVPALPAQAPSPHTLPSQIQSPWKPHLSLCTRFWRRLLLPTSLSMPWRCYACPAQRSSPNRNPRLPSALTSGSTTASGAGSCYSVLPKPLPSLPLSPQPLHQRLAQACVA